MSVILQKDKPRAKPEILLTGIIWPCCICKEVNKSGRSKGFRHLYALERHILEQHKEYRGLSGLTFEKAINMIANTEELLKFGMIRP